MTTERIGPETGESRTTAEAFRVLTAGYDFYLVERLWERLGRATGFEFSHLFHPGMTGTDVDRHRHPNCHVLRPEIHVDLPSPDREFLASLEADGVPTVHNMILCDVFVRELGYVEAFAYATYVARRMEAVYRAVRPDVIVSGFDGFHSSMALAVARKLGIPFFTISYTSMPTGFTGFCTGMSTATCFPVREMPEHEVRAVAESALRAFEAHRLLAPTIVTENNLRTILARLPQRFRSLVRAVRRAMTSRYDRFSQPGIVRSIRTYFRKRWNLARLPRHWFVDVPPETPYLFLGLHMQPEMAIDVWAPFYSDQFHVIESIARAMPPSHELMVKLHKIDADNYSRAELDRLRRLPGVRIVSPFASSRAFIEKADLVFSIQGTITVEAAMLGRPVLAFGDTKYDQLPTVTMVGRVTELPGQIRAKLKEPVPSREAIVEGLVSYLRCYAPGIYNDWDVVPPDEGIANLAVLFMALRDYLQSSPQRGTGPASDA